MKNSADRPAFRIAFCAAIASLETVLMMVTGLIRVGTYAIPCFAGMLTIAIVIEYRCKWAFAVYAVTAILGFFLSGDKEAVVMFIAFFGYYPILKNILESRIRNKILLYLIKFAVFNAAAVGSFFVMMFVFSMPADEFTLFGVYIPYVFLIIGNVFFLLYDLAINVYVKFYVQRLRNALFGRK